MKHRSSFVFAFECRRSSWRTINKHSFASSQLNQRTNEYLILARFIAREWNCHQQLQKSFESDAYTHCRTEYLTPFQQVLGKQTISASKTSFSVSILIRQLQI